MDQGGVDQALIINWISLKTSRQIPQTNAWSLSRRMLAHRHQIGIIRASLIWYLPLRQSSAHNLAMLFEE